ncbi:multiple coagulation factor deficiency protein 2 homolog isoform X2 [Dreissena polymorpha]|uniref:multiple coagulation factor deficiency protein 2 homolog isoform X2 n=1 Tax=Dreissena polymorpha TaxID=45954 RepID=UPI0022652C86|nr:multiple coagulation factor deficiency protein 2 homolog isoform X2 [Dreissena polymorpha]
MRCNKDRMNSIITTTVCILVSVCVSHVTSQGAHPPGVPPPNMNQQHHQHQGQAQEIHGTQGRNVHPEGFGVNPHDAEHIKEHLKDVVEKPKEEMTEEELEFHYFKLHDYDGNNKLDGVEITKAITHFHDEEPDKDTGKPRPPPPTLSDKDIEGIIDSILQQDDLNKDGYIEYMEFVTAQRKARGKN